MKTNIITSAVLGATLLLTLATQAADPVFSVNMVGFQKTTLDSNNVKLMASPFYKNGTNTLSDLIGDQATVGTDQVFLYDEVSQGFQIFVHAGGGTWVETVSGFPLATNDLLPGTGFFYINDAVSNEVVIVGEVVLDNTITNSIPAGFSILSNPYSSDLDLNATNVTLSSLLNIGTDSIYLLESGLYTRYIYTGTQIVKASPPFDVPIPVVASGTAFWIDNTGGIKNWIQPALY